MIQVNRVDQSAVTVADSWPVPNFRAVRLDGPKPIHKQFTSSSGQVTSNYSSGLDIHNRFAIAVDWGQVWWGMVPIVHADRNAVKLRDPRHRSTEGASLGNATDHGDRSVAFGFRTEDAEVSRGSDGSALVLPTAALGFPQRHSLSPRSSTTTPPGYPIATDRATFRSRNGFEQGNRGRDEAGHSRLTPVPSGNNGSLRSNRNLESSHSGTLE